MSDDTQRCEDLLGLATRLAGAVEADIAALEDGTFPPLALGDPEIERLSLLFTREVAAAKSVNLKDAPAGLLKTVLKRHERLVYAMRSASEGMVRAVAEEVERQRLAAMPYSALPQARRSASGAIVYNRVI
jgi:hypothetical protein